jgi:hypothetical protein
MTTGQTPLGAVARGVVAGLVGTGLMTVAQELSAKLHSSGDGGQQGGDGEQHGEQDPWDQASAPAKVAKRVSEGVFGHEVPAERIPLLTHGMHWGYGTGWGGVYGLAQGSLPPSTLRPGLLFGSTVWAMSYVQLVPMGLYEPPWKYAAKDIAMEVGYHLVYGLGVASAFKVLDSR